MWHNARLLNFAANVLFGVAGFIVACIVVLSALNSSMFPLRTLSIEGDLQHVDAEAVSEAMANRPVGNFFAVDLEAVRVSMENIPWVRRADVRRQWPDRLSVHIEEQVPIAYWGDKGEEKLVNRYGELFSGASEQALPQFTGPLGSEMQIAYRYAEFSEMLAPLNASVLQVLLSPRSAWQLKVTMKNQPALTLMLGRGEGDKSDESVRQRLARFVRHYPAMQAQLNRNVQYIDLRYPNGFTVRVPEIEKKSGNV